MPELSYDRYATRIIITGTPEGGARVRFGRSWILLKSDEVDAARTADPGFEIAAGRRGRIPRLQRWWQIVLQQLNSESHHEPLGVAELHVEPDLAAVAWEDFIKAGSPVLRWPALTMVRAAPVPSRAAAWPLTLPIRILQVETPLPPIEDRLDGLFKWSRQSRELVLDGSSCSAEQLDPWWQQSRWSTADICEVGIPARVSEADAASAADPSELWTVGWLERVCQRLRPRLLVLLEDGPATAARVMAQRIVDRGGPAVLVVPPPQLGRLRNVYMEIVHDRPLDWIVSTASETGSQSRPSMTLWTDPARSEALRVSSSFLPMLNVTEQLLSPEPDAAIESRVADQLRFLTEHSDVPSTNRLQSLWRRGGVALLRQWASSSFNMHESEGVLPMQQAVIRMRDQLQLPGPLDVSRPAVAAQDLTVTPRLAQESEDATVHQIGQFDQIQRSRPVIVGVGVGPYDDLITVAGAAALLQEAVFADVDQAGAWLDVAVVGLNTTVLGEQVQRLWVPRGSPSEQASFRVDPGQRKSWRVRLCLYRDNLLLQALLVAGVSGPETAEARRRLLARQLVMGIDQVPEEATWFARTEYTLTAGEFDRLPGTDHRAVSITANTLDDAKVLMFKGDDLAVEVRLSSDVDRRVEAARADLAHVSTPPIPRVHPDDLPYGFNDDNTAKPGGYNTSMIALASRGWKLYEGILPQASRAQLSNALDTGNGSILSVGHLLIEHVLPWSMVYDRPFDKGSQATELLACHALQDDGELPDQCGELDSCPLNPKRQAERTQEGKPHAREATVACPRHFWGFRHIVELPVTRARTSAAASTNTQGPISAGFGEHHDLSLAGPHLAQMSTLINSGQPPNPWLHGNRDQFQEALQAGLDVDLVYLYCHAGFDGYDEVLRLKDANDAAEGLLAASDLAGDTFHTQPLVFINGCRTTGFSPKALSPFITTLVTDRNASGLVGTEIDVWEQLAVEVGREFVGQFCNVPGMTAGRALRETRLRLLAKGNPLGLAYTLYALADLRLRP